MVRVSQYADPRHTRYHFRQQGEKLLGKISSDIGISGDVATRSRQTRHKTRTDRVRDRSEDDGDRACRPVSRQSNRGCRHDEHIDLEVEQLSKEHRNALVAVRKSWFNDDVASVDVAVF